MVRKDEYTDFVILCQHLIKKTNDFFPPAAAAELNKKLRQIWKLLLYRLR